MKLKRCPLENSLLNKIDPVTGREGLSAARWHLNQKRPESHAEIVLDIDGPLAAWGVNKKWSCVGEIWLAVDKRLIGDFGRQRNLVRLGRERLHWLEDELGFRRLEAAFGVNVPTYGLCKATGFEIEGKMKNYGIDGEGDFYLMARTVE